MFLFCRTNIPLTPLSLFAIDYISGFGLANICNQKYILPLLIDAYLVSMRNTNCSGLNYVSQKPLPRTSLKLKLLINFSTSSCHFRFQLEYFLGLHFLFAGVSPSIKQVKCAEKEKENE